ncbi:MAG: hypothetical protein V4621_05095 [Pseudomonadota bacterium]
MTHQHDGFETQKNAPGTDLAHTFAPATDATGAAVGTYAHPHSDTILTAVTDILQQTESGRYMLQVMHHYKISARVIKGRDVTYQNPDEFSVVLVAPEKFQAQIELLAMYLYCGIRDVEQSYCGFRRPDAATMNAVEFSNLIFSKGFDIVIHSFRIADELYARYGHQKVLDKINELGHNDLYKAYKSGADLSSLQNLYLEKEYEAVN